MGLYSNFPYTNFHEMNLDWILQQLKDLVDAWDAFGGTVSATAHTALQPEVSVSGDLKTGLDFDFGLVQGSEGPQGPEGPEGPQGKGLEILGVYDTLADLQTAHPTGDVGDIYLVGTGGSYTMYVWDEDTSSWHDGGAMTSPAPSSTSPAMDGTAAAGSSLDYSRADHVHPSDTSKQDALVSGTNIKTVNSYSLLGSGNIAVQPTLVSGTNIKTINTESLLGSTDIAVQVPLVSGTNIKTINSESLLGSTDIAVQVPLVSGTNIKTINNQSLLGSGDISIASGGFKGVDTANVLASYEHTANSFAQLSHTATEDCWAYACADNSHYSIQIDGVTVGNGGNVCMLIPLKTGQTITSSANGSLAWARSLIIYGMEA